MKNIKITLIFFILLALAQLAIPGIMIYDMEHVLNHGVEYKFKTAPVDPVDAMRGKYVALRYEIEEYETTMDEVYEENSEIYVLLKKDSADFAVIDQLLRSKPQAGDYLKVKIAFTFTREEKQIIHLELPFDRYYMEESKAAKAENMYREFNTRGNESETFAVVRVKDGNAVLSDLYIDSYPIRTYFKSTTPN